MDNIQGAVVLAIDVERLGQDPTQYSTVECAASVVTEYPELKELDSFSHSEYRSQQEYSSHYKFEPQCKTSFWDKNPHLLRDIEADTPVDISVEESRKRMIEGLCTFINSWRIKCESTPNCHFIITMDNKICDAHTVNALVNQYLGKDHPILPLTFDSPPRYQKIHETTSLIWGILMGGGYMNPVDQKGSSGGSLLRSLYDIPPYERSHTHRARDDAYVTACDYQVCLAISRGQIKVKNYHH